MQAVAASGMLHVCWQGRILRGTPVDSGGAVTDLDAF